MERLSIPPEFSSYSEEKGIFTLYEGMLQALLTVRPDCPLQLLSQHLSVDRSKSGWPSLTHNIVHQLILYVWMFTACVQVRSQLLFLACLVPNVVVYGPPCSGQHSVVSVTIYRVCICTRYCSYLEQAHSSQDEGSPCCPRESWPVSCRHWGLSSYCGVLQMCTTTCASWGMYTITHGRLSSTCHLYTCICSIFATYILE